MWGCGVFTISDSGMSHRPCQGFNGFQGSLQFSFGNEHVKDSQVRNIQFFLENELGDINNSNGCAKS